jgi:hypothetical protein
MANALEALGLKREQSELEKLCRCSATSGTSTPKMMAALRSIPSLSPSRIYQRSHEAAFWHLNGSLSLGRPVILCVDSGAHWVSCIGQLGVGQALTRYIVADSGDLDLVMTYDLKGLLTRWGPPYLGISL